jgi:organic radical activating enzyme
MHSADWLRQIGKYPIHRDDYNPYIEAFWKWWPELYPKLDTFRITGGEPLLSKHTWKVFEYIKENPNDKMEFAVNTNLCVPDKLIDRLIEEVKGIEGKIKEFKIFTSAESASSHAEYTRYGMNYEVFISNINKIMTALPNVRIVLMTTVNALSAFSFKDFLEDIIILRAKHYKTAAKSTLGLSVNYLRWPQFQDIRILPAEIKQESAKEVLEFVYKHKDKLPEYGEAMFYLEEIDQVERLTKYMEQDLPNRDNLLLDFKMFYNEYDRRRDLNFAKTFPEIAFMVE